MIRLPIGFHESSTPYFEAIEAPRGMNNKQTQSLERGIKTLQLTRNVYILIGTDASGLSHKENVSGSFLAICRLSTLELEHTSSRAMAFVSGKGDSAKRRARSHSPGTDLGLYCKNILMQIAELGELCATCEPPKPLLRRVWGVKSGAHTFARGLTANPDLESSAGPSAALSVPVA